MPTTSDFEERVDDLEHDIEEMQAAATRDEEVIRQLSLELDFVKEQHAQTSARKSNLMRDWLADQRTKWRLRCQLRGHGYEPIV